MLRFIALTALCAFSFGACAAQVEQVDVKISNFKFGLACSGELSSDNRSRPSHICHESKDVFVTGQGQCLAEGDWVPCTWYGFEFDYLAASAQTRIECVVSYRNPQNFVNVEESVAEDTRTFTYSIELAGKRGRHFQAQYSIFSYRRPEVVAAESRTVCRYNELVLFEFDDIVHFPARTPSND